MSDRISRRKLVTLAGAGLATPSCSALLRHHRGMNSAGMCLDWGAPASGPPTYDVKGKPKVTTEFEPDFITIVHVDFAQAWRIDVNHASFRISNNTESGRLTQVLNTLMEKVRPITGSKKRFAELKSHKPIPRKNGQLDKNNFDSFGFNSKHEIFFFFDNDAIDFNDRALITFTPLGSDGQGPPNSLYFDQNYSFFNARPVTKAEMNGYQLGGKILRVENHMTLRDGSDIDREDIAEAQKYSMNIHFLMRSVTDAKPGQLNAKKRDFMAMVMDPDTGNGAGSEP
jgi:hypothetical protein